MKLSVSLTEKDVEFLDFYISERDLESRSAGLQAALRALRDVELEEAYERAFSEEARYEDPEVLAEWQRMWDEGGGPLFPDADKPR
jgi:Arc/MetJ-type ribon-helix-helix transcriptional regulator